MTQRQPETVPNYADLVEDYKRKYPQTERKALKKLILSQYPHLNVRSVNRHLSKLFDPTSNLKSNTIPKAETKPSNKLHVLLQEYHLRRASRKETFRLLRLLYETDPKARALISDSLMNSAQRKRETQVIMPTDSKVAWVGKKPDGPVTVEPSLKDMTSNLDEYLNDRELEALVVSILATSFQTS